MKKTYPIPFSKDFYEDLNKNLSDKKIHSEVESKYSHIKTVVLIKITHKKKDFLLDELTDWILANSVVEKIAGFHEVQKIKSNGSLGIFICDKNEVAINFALDLKDNLTDLFTISIGLCRGDVLLFNMGTNGWEIAGGPVNIASKIAEDSGEENCVLIESSVKCNKKDCKPFTYNISHVDISGVKL